MICADEDGVVAPNPLADCSMISRPSPFELCSQIDCNTGEYITLVPK